jgi:hypothetical protein
MIEQAYVTTLFADEGCTGMEMHQRLKDHYGDNAISRT